ncbi:MAG: RHS repeat domain-containing protein [Pyrinomonadaceae bacterium]
MELPIIKSFASGSQTVVRFSCFAMLSVVLTANAFGQSATDGSTPSGLTRGAPAGSYALSGFDNVNLFNGNINFRVPLLSIGGRGGARGGMMLKVDSKKWRVEHYNEEFYQADIPNPDWWTAVEVGYGPGVLLGRKSGVQTRNCSDQYGSWQVLRYSFTTLTFTAPDGTEYDFRDQNTLGQPLTTTGCSSMIGPSRGTVFVTVDGSAATFIADAAIYDTLDPYYEGGVATSGYMILRDGARYRIDGGKVTWIRDRNGNKVSFTYDANYRVTTITDSLNRQVAVAYDVNEGGVYGVCDRVTFKGSGGQQRIIRVSKTSMSNALRAGFTIQSPQQLFPELDGGPVGYNPTVPWKLWLPNSDGTGQHYQFYQFFYNSFGELARVELPTGGAVEYDMTPGSGVVSEYEIYRRVVERRVYVDGNTLEKRETYSAAQSVWSDPWPWTTTVTVDQLSASAQLLARSKHYFNGSGLAALVSLADRLYI